MRATLALTALASFAACNCPVSGIIFLSSTGAGLASSATSGGTAGSTGGTTTVGSATAGSASAGGSGTSGSTKSASTGSTGKASGGSSAAASNGGTASTGGATSGAATAGSTATSTSGSASSSTGGAGNSTGGSSGASTSGSSSSGGVVLVAGQLGGPGNADGVGSASRFYMPMGLTPDGNGNLFVCDSWNNTLREVDLATNDVTTFAGQSEVTGWADGVGTAATFTRPSWVVDDGAGNLYVSDTNFNIIRQIVVATANVTTLAGTAPNSGSADGVGPAASFAAPGGLALDGKGNLYLADTGNDTIRKIVIATADVTTLAGQVGVRGGDDGTGTAAQFNIPSAVAYYGGNLYVADGTSIRQLVLSSLAVTTLAGQNDMPGYADDAGANALFNFPYGIVVDKTGSNLYVAEPYNADIRQVTLPGGVVSTFAGTSSEDGPINGTADGTGPAAQFMYPQGLAFDATFDTLYLTDGTAATLRTISVPGAVVTTVDGLAPSIGSSDGPPGTSLFNEPNAIASDGAGHLYLADSYNQEIREIDEATGDVTTVAGTPGVLGSQDGPLSEATFRYPGGGIAADGQGNVYVSDNTSCIRWINLDAGMVSTLAGVAGNYGSGNGVGSAATFEGPSGLALDGQGNLYVADTGNYDIREINLASANVTTVAGSPSTFGGSMDGIGAAAQFYYPQGLAYYNGVVYITDTGNFTLRAMATSNFNVTTVAGVVGSSQIGSPTLFGQPLAVAVDAAGNVYVADDTDSTIRQVDVTSGLLTTLWGVAGQAKVILGALPAQLDRPYGLAWEGGTLYAIDVAENVVLSAAIP